MLEKSQACLCFALVGLNRLWRSSDHRLVVAGRMCLLNVRVFVARGFARFRSWLLIFVSFLFFLLDVFVQSLSCCICIALVIQWIFFNQRPAFTLM